MARDYVFKIGTLLCLTLFNWRSVLGSLCFSCNRTFQPAMCMRAKLCAADEVCYIERGLVSNGGVKYYSGCLSQSACLAQAPVHLDLAVHQCQRCCLGDFCNIRGCGSLAIMDEDQLACLACSDLSDPVNCMSTSVCRKNELCGARRRLLNGAALYDLGCFSSLACLDGDTKCCSVNGCNYNMTFAPNPTPINTTPVETSQPTNPATNEPTTDLTSETPLSTSPGGSTTGSVGDLLTSLQTVSPIGGTSESTTSGFDLAGMYGTDDYSSTTMMTSTDMGGLAGMRTDDYSSTTMMPSTDMGGLAGMTTGDYSSTVMSTTGEDFSTTDMTGLAEMRTDDVSSSTVTLSTDMMRTDDYSSTTMMSSTDMGSLAGMTTDVYESTPTAVSTTGIDLPDYSSTPDVSTDWTSTGDARQMVVTTALPISAPRIVGPDYMTVSKQSGSDFVLTCNATGSGPITYTWVIPKNGRGDIRQNGNLLVIQHIGDIEAGNYVCEATNSGGTSRKVVKVEITNMRDAVPVITSIKDNVWIKGSAVPSLQIIQCDVTGKPEPQVTWDKIDGSATSASSYTYKHGTIVFPALDASLDSGLYVCNATNGVTSDTSYAAVYQDKTVDCKTTFSQFRVTLVYRATCPSNCQPVTLPRPPSPGTVSKSSLVCSSLVADSTGQVAWMLRPSGQIVQLTTDKKGQIEVTNL